MGEENGGIESDAELIAIAETGGELYELSVPEEARQQLEQSLSDASEDKAAAED